MYNLKVKCFLILLILSIFILPSGANPVSDGLDLTSRTIKNSVSILRYGLKSLNSGVQAINSELQKLHTVHVNNMQALSEKKVSKDLKKIKKKIIKKEKRTYKNTPNDAPKTFEDYIAASKDVKRADFKIPEPVYEKDAKIVDLPDPTLRIVKYNLPPGSQDINLSTLISNRKVNSTGVLSPDQSKMVYSIAYYYPTENQVSSEMYYINVDKSLSLQQKIEKANEIFKERTPILSTGIDQLQNKAFKTLVLVDWSKDGKRVAVKEKVGSTIDGVWQTDLLVYDFETKQSRKLTAVREAIRYWWKTNENIDLIDYMWDIYPVGWDSVNPDRIIVYAYAYTNANPKFLGTWSIDYKGERSELMSLLSTDFAISTNGLSLKMVVRE